MYEICRWQGYDLRSQIQREPDRIQAALFRIDIEEPAESQFVIHDAHIICVHLDGHIDWALDAPGRRYRRAALPRTLCAGWAGETARAVYSKARAQFVHFYVPQKTIDSYLRECGVRPDSVDFIDPGNQVDDEIFALAARATQLMTASPATRMLFDAVGLSLIARLLENWSSLRSSVNMMGTVQLSQFDWRLRRAIDYLETRLQDDVGLDELARAVDLSPAHLATLFRAGTGVPPHRWLIRRRVARACDLLARSSDTITEIAFACGFASSQHFSRTFRQHMGLTPMKFRRGNRM